MSTSISSIVRFVFSFTVLAAIAACSSGTDGSTEIVAPFDNTVATVTISPDTWDANRIGQRQQFTATALNSSGDTIPGVQFAWGSSAADVVSVDAVGLALALSANPNPATVTATADNIVGSATLTVTSEIPSDVAGIMYTVWFARSDDAPALIVDGKLEVAKDIYCLNINNDDLENPRSRAWQVCPDANYPSDPLHDPDGTRNDPGVLPVSPIPSFPNPPDPTTPWSYPDVAKFQWKGDRIGILSDMFEGRGTFRVLERHQEWTILALANAKDFQLSNQLTAVLIDDGASQVNALRVKAGTFGPFRLIASGGVRQFQIEDDYIGVLFDDGLFRMKKGLDSSDWKEFAVPGDGVREFAMELVVDENDVSHIRVGEIFDDGRFRVKDELEGLWETLVLSGVKEFQLEGDHIGVLLDDGTIKIKKGIFGSWAVLAGPGAGVKDFAMQELTDGNGVRYARVAILFDDGLLRVKDGIFSSTWIDVSTGVQRVKLQENYIGALKPDGTLRVKEGIFGGWRETTAYGSGVTQFRLVVDVPVPPVRTTMTSFNANRAECSNQGTNASGDLRCYRERTYGFPSDFYGRFCGGEHPGPNDVDWYWAVGVGEFDGGGPMDSMDALCKHHDAAYPLPSFPLIGAPDLRSMASWYPEAAGTNTNYLCVVRYGLQNAKLTENGIPKDTRERDNWGGLEELYGTIYFGPTSFWEGAIGILGCSVGLIDELTTFTDKTKANHNNE